MFPDDYRVPFQKRRLVGIPEGLFQHYNSEQPRFRPSYFARSSNIAASVTTHMGLMPELERVWISIDHNLFLWDYMEGCVALPIQPKSDSHIWCREELSSFTDQPDVISHVALVKPKPGVFIDEIAWLLVICTPVSVLLIGVSSTPTPGPNRRLRREIRLYATDMSVVTEVEMASVISTPDGRILMCGLQDGNLYELHYQEKEGWFEKRVQLINHSVGGVQSFFPMLNSSKSGGMSYAFASRYITHSL